MSQDTPITINPNDAVKLSVLAGDIMLANGSETFRVEDTMRRLLINCGYDNPQTFVIASGVIASVTCEDFGTVTHVRRTKSRTNNIGKIISVNDVSRSLADGRITSSEAVKKLEEIRVAAGGSLFEKIVATGIACFCFTYMSGGMVPDCVNALLTGCVFQLLLIQLNKGRVADVLTNIINGVMIAFLALTFLNLGVGDNLNSIIIGSILPILPGITTTNAIRDIFEGDYVSGTARVVDAVVISMSIATGVGVILKLWFSLFGGAMI